MRVEIGVFAERDSGLNFIVQSLGLNCAGIQSQPYDADVVLIGEKAYP
jgi:hypothetical protein